MPRTRKKIIKTVFKDDDESDQEKDEHDFSDSGSDAKISDYPSSEEDEEPECPTSSDEDVKSIKRVKKTNRSSTIRKENKTNFTKSFMAKINKQKDNEESTEVEPVLFSVKDLTDADKLLPSILNLSESDSSDDESPAVAVTTSKFPAKAAGEMAEDSENDIDSKVEYMDVWSNNIEDESEEIAKRTFLELEQHKNKVEETKMSIQNYSVKMDTQANCDVKDLLALGEEAKPQTSYSSHAKKVRKKMVKDDSDSEMEDWEEVKETKGIPQQGLQLILDVPNAVCRKTKKLDVEMMMKRKMNRVKKENQIYLHKVHVLCWLAHGNYISEVLNDQTILGASLSLVPSKECYPGERVDMKYVEQITTWYKDKVTLRQDKYETKFRPKAPPLKDLLLQQIKSKIFSTKKYIVFVFVSMLRSLGLQCRIMFNFVTLPIRPPSFELLSLSTKLNDDKKEIKQTEKAKKGSSNKSAKVLKPQIPQLDGNYDMSCSSDSDNIMQVDGSDDTLADKNIRQKCTQESKKHTSNETDLDQGNVSPPKRPRRNCTIRPGPVKEVNRNKKNCQKLNKSDVNNKTETTRSRKSLLLNRLDTEKNIHLEQIDLKISKSTENLMDTGTVSRKTRHRKLSGNATVTKPDIQVKENSNKTIHKKDSLNVPQLIVTNENGDVSSKYFGNESTSTKKSLQTNRKRSKTTEDVTSKKTEGNEKRVRAKSSQNNCESKYFVTNANKEKKPRGNKDQTEDSSEDNKRVSHRDLHKKTKGNNDVTNDLIHIIKGRVKEAKADAKKNIVKEKIKKESDEDSDYLPVQSPNRKISESDDDFKPHKVNVKTKVKTVKKIDRRVLSTDDELSQNNLNKIDVWCEVYVEELEEWVAVDVIKGSVHCVNEIYGRSTHPVAYVVGWDNNNYLKDLTKKYVPYWNTVTRKQRVESPWWDVATRLWLGPKTARDREEDERLNRMQLEAPLPKVIGEYKNHPLYALKRHLLKFEAIYPPDASTLGFVRGEAVYARECVYICRSRDTWLKEAKVVKLGEQPYKVVKARPKWDKLSNRLITDKPLEVFGPWQVQDYEPPTAENGIVPRNAYGNVELFKQCMLPKGTVHLKLPSLNRVAKKLNIDCAPAMTGFDFNGGWSHPVYEGFVVCKEFEEIIMEAWIKDQEDQERKEMEKTEARVYGNWRRLIRGLLIKERLKAKYGFQEPSTSTNVTKKGPRLVVKKKK